MKRALSLVLFFVGAVSLHAAMGTWSITKRIHLGGEGGWDYLTADVDARRLYVSHAKRVVVLDLDDNSVVASLDANGVHGIALAKDLNRGFISNGGNGTVTIFRLSTLRPIASVKVGQNPDAICYEPVTKQVFAFNGRSQSVSVIDAAKGKVVGEVALPGKPEFAAVDDAGHVFDAIEDKGLILEIDAAKRAITAQWNLPASCEPSALAIDPSSHRLFVGCGDQMLRVLDAGTGHVLLSFPIGQGVDAVAFDSVRHRIFASCRVGTMTVIDEKAGDNFSLEAHVPTQPGSRTMAVDSLTGKAYLPAGKFGPVPKPTPEHPEPHAPVLPGTLQVLVVSPP